VVAVRVEHRDPAVDRTRRHACRTPLLEERTPPHVVKQIAGHAALYATMTIYANASAEQRQAVR
jgi:hypothetical protein